MGTERKVEEIADRLSIGRLAVIALLDRVGIPAIRLERRWGGHESKLAYCGNVLIENRNGIVVDTELLACGKYSFPRGRKRKFMSGSCKNSLQIF